MYGSCCAVGASARARAAHHHHRALHPPVHLQPQPTNNSNSLIGRAFFGGFRGFGRARNLSCFLGLPVCFGVSVSLRRHNAIPVELDARHRGVAKTRFPDLPVLSKILKKPRTCNRTTGIYILYMPYWYTVYYMPYRY